MHEVGINKTIVIVTPTIDLVEQFYTDFLTTIDLFKKISYDKEKSNANIKPINKSHVIKISSKQDHIHADLIGQNSIANKNLVFIICQKSFFEILEKRQGFL